MREVASEERASLGIGELDPLDPYVLAADHGIPVYDITELAKSGCSTNAIKHFTSKRARVWSAALIPLGAARLIIENTAHSIQRRRASIAHELGHHLLEHEFHDAILTDDGCRRFDPAREKEATFLAGELLIPKKAAERAAFKELSNTQVATWFGVSEPFAQMRMAGARVIAKRALAKQAKAARPHR